MSIKLSGPWSSDQIESYLHKAAVPLRLSCIANDGYPRVVSMWYHPDGPNLVCVTHQSSKVVPLLRKNPKVGFEISGDSPPYQGIRGQGMATLSPLGDSSSLEQLLMRYIGNLDSEFSQWLLSRSAEELIVTISPSRLYSWDYRQRMSTAQ